MSIQRGDVAQPLPPAVGPVGAVEGAGVPQTVARMEAAVNQGDYAKALSEYDTLPEAAKAHAALEAGGVHGKILLPVG